MVQTEAAANSSEKEKRTIGGRKKPHQKRIPGKQVWSVVSCVAVR